MKPKTVLIVDDNKLTRQGLADLLKDVKINTVEATNGTEGLKLALEKHPDLIVADVRMPDMDGLQMVERLRTDSWGSQVAVIMLTADESLPSINEALVAGVTVYLNKANRSPAQVVEQIVAALG